MFKDRADAARQIIPKLEGYKNDEAVVLAVPRGGVPIGYDVAMAYQLPLDIILTKKIGFPGNPELAVGAVSLEEEVLDPRFTIDTDYLAKETASIRQVLQERYKKFMGHRQPLKLEGKTVIIVDDGIATGNTIMAAIRMIRKRKPAKLVLAVPVAPLKTVIKLRAIVDDLICILAAEDFYAVGQYYEDFTQVSDVEVIRLLKEAASHIDGPE